MAHVDPRIIGASPSVPRFELKIHDIAPEDIIPNGDRYVVEVLDVDETKLAFANLLVVTQAKVKPGDPQADPNIEPRGVIPAVVVTKGNGHLLGLSDHPRNGNHQHEREWASVPMFYDIGDIVLIDHNGRGRALKIHGRESRIVNQIDVLGHIPKLKLTRTEDGRWKQSTKP